MSRMNRAPFVRSESPEETGVEYRYDARLSLGLGDAHYYDGIALSLPSHPEWDDSEISLTRHRLDSSAEILSDDVSVRQMAQPVHVDTHLDWLTTGILRTMQTGADLWAHRSNVFPRLRFLPRTEAMLRGLEKSHVAAVAHELALLDRCATEWDPARDAAPLWRSKVTPEHETRRKSGDFDFVDEDGTLQTFDMHGRFTGNVPGRIYFRLAHQEHKLVIAHVGRKIGA
ncbi:hypothetical protein [Cellulosimicrobium cellulans]|uniref:hypothetical protein n=1 Tax=Cellulosimicrobium cellulans TaxID=1710 RepID=UPI0020984D43|nr:hypothetical protein [Cellulosimicrobium cellulans]MCO7272100.1 hypothetical protein [Cellulosimicrobium cellulans]